MATRRTASHAGSWYSGSKLKLNSELDNYLKNVPDSQPGIYDSLPVPGARFLVGPHAGYAFAGQTLAETYKAWDISNIKRVFILGPSHHVYFKGALLSAFDTYETPIGDVPVDQGTTQKLMKSGLFNKMSSTVDEDEHSFEMHMPFLYKVCQQQGYEVPPIVPILIGASSTKYEEQLADLLSPYFKDKENAFVISTDFCHWGDRFDYMVYTQKPDCSDLTALTRSNLNPDVPIYQSIEYLDRLGMKAASTGSYKAFNQYLKDTDNTICGRRPLAALLRTIELTRKDSDIDDDDEYGLLKWVGYAQSSKITNPARSSVSYASGFAVA